MNHKELLESATSAYQREDFKSAITDYQQLISQTKDEPTKANAYHQIGRCYHKLDQSRKAIYHFIQAEYLSTAAADKANIYYDLAKAYHKLKEYQKAIDNYSLALKNYSTPTSQAAAYFQIGNCYQELKEYRTAIQNYQTARENYTAPQDLQKVQAKQASAEEKMRNQSPAHREKSQEEKEKELLAQAKETFHSGNHEKALEIINQIIKTTQDNQIKTEAYRQRGDIYTQMEKSNEALKDYQKVIGLRWKGNFSRLKFGFKKYCAKALKSLLKP